MLRLQTVSSKFKYRNVFNTLSYFFRSEKPLPSLDRAFSRVSEHFQIPKHFFFSDTEKYQCTA